MVAEFRRETSLTYMSTSGLGDWAGREQAQDEEVKGHFYQSQMPWKIIGPSSRCQVSAVLPGECPRPRRWPGLCGTLPNFPSSSYKQGACQAVIHTHTHTHKQVSQSQIIFVFSSPPEQSVLFLSILNKHVCVLEAARK